MAKQTPPLIPNDLTKEQLWRVLHSLSHVIENGMRSGMYVTYPYYQGVQHTYEILYDVIGYEVEQARLRELDKPE